MREYSKTKDRIRNLKEEYYSCTNLKLLAENYNTTPGALKIFCKRRGFRRNPELYQKADIYKKTLSPLLIDSNFNWYWYGFITGDGNINRYYLNITLHLSDENHLKILSDNLNIDYSIRQSICSLLISDAYNIEALKSKLGYIEERKTYVPLILNTSNKEFFMCFIFGLIDADGCIEVSKNDVAKQIRIELHESWLENLNIISDFLSKNYDIDSKVIINNRGYSQFQIFKHPSIVRLRQIGLDLGIPLMERKWNKFKLTTEGCGFFKDRRNEIISLYKQGYNIRQISIKLGLNYNSINNHKKDIIRYEDSSTIAD